MIGHSFELNVVPGIRHENKIWGWCGI